MRRTFTFVTLISVFLALAGGSRPASAQGSCTNTLSQPAGQTFWVGPIAANNQNGAVVVFVHGYNDNHGAWTGANNAVLDACTQGFRVAAVDLGGTASIWTNGEALAGKLDAIAAYFGVGRVNVMAHSKGGIDTQTAIVHYGAHNVVQAYIAFGTPFGGTDLADHACSWYGFWIWQCNDATWVMRTGYMAYVRGITDPRPENQSVTAHAARGNKCDWYNPACGLIAGPDDGVVPSWSVWANGVDSHIIDRADLRHGEIHQTQRHNRAWLFSHLGRETVGGIAVSPEERAHPRAAPAQSSALLRGGQAPVPVVERFPVEAGVEAVVLSLVATGPMDAQAVGPDGAVYALDRFDLPQESLLRGVAYRVRIVRPEAGEWSVRLAPSGDAAGKRGYYFNVFFEGGVAVSLQNDPAATLRPGATLALPLETSERVQALEVRATLRDRAQRVVAESPDAARGIVLPRGNGTYNLDITATGFVDGKPFERTIVSSVAVVDGRAVVDPAAVE